MRHEDNLFIRIALRTIESSRWLGLAEDVRDAVVADTVTGAEIGMSVVVEGAPADASGILRVGCQLVVYARMANSVFALPLILSIVLVG